MNRVERRQLAMRVRRGIASARDHIVLGYLKSIGISSGRTRHKVVVAGLRSMDIPPDQDAPEHDAYRQARNARKRVRRLRRGR